MAFGRTALAMPLLIFNLVLYALLLGFASWAYSRFSNGVPVAGANNVSRDLALVSLLAGVLGLASVIAGLHHAVMPGSGSRGAAAATSTIATAVTLLMLGIASKHISIGHVRSRRLRTLEAFAIIPAATQLLHTMLTYLMKRDPRHDTHAQLHSKESAV